MSYDSRESSTHDGAPVELYEFTRGTTVSRFTSAAKDVVLGDLTYLAEPLRRSRIEATRERTRSALKITCRRDFPIAELFRVSPPSEVIAFVLKRFHRGDAEVKAIWVGRVLNCLWGDGSATAELNVEPASTSLKRNGLTRSYQRNCPHVLYSQGTNQCGVDRAAHSTVTTVTAIDRSKLTVAALGAKPWPGGFVEWDSGDGHLERRFIVAASGLELTLTWPFQGIAIGASVTASPGCDQTRGTCANTYDNLDAHGGFPFTPGKNPFGNNPVY